MTLSKWCLFFCVVLFTGCSSVGSDSSRVDELNAMPALYTSRVITASPGSAHMKNYISTFNDVVATLMSKKKTEHFIPDDVMAYPERMAKYHRENNGHDGAATIAIGDRVEVLDFQTSSKNETFGLVRTSAGTYAWIPDWHLTDKFGERLNRFQT